MWGEGGVSIRGGAGEEAGRATGSGFLGSAVVTGGIWAEGRLGAQATASRSCLANWRTTSMEKGLRTDETRPGGVGIRR